MLLMINRYVKRLLVPMLIVSILITACGAAASPQMVSKESGGSVPPVQPALPGEVRNFAASQSGAVPDAGTQAIERVVIKNASLTIVVDNPATSMDTISKMAEELGGYVVSANVYKQELDSGAQVPRASITIRIPAERLNEVLERIKKESKQDPISENISSQDITLEYTDLQSRLTNLENAEAQLTKIMDAATKTEDVMSVYSQLVQVREQIEVLKGQIKYYDESAKLSSVSIELMANEAIQPLQIGGWQPVGVAKNAVQALIDTLKFLVNALIWIIIYIGPVLLVLYFVFFLPLSLLRRAWRKRHPKTPKPPKGAQPPAPSEPKQA